MNIVVKCVSCGAKKEYSGKEQPMCDKCFSPMVAVKAIPK